MKKIIIFIFLAANLFAGGKNDLLLLPSPKMPINVIQKAMFLDICNTGKRIVAVGEQGFIIYSDNNGKTWKQADVPVRVTLTSVYFPDSKNGWAVGHSGVILHTTNGGKTWKKQLDGYKANKLIVEGLEKILQNKEFDNNSMSIDDLEYFFKDSKETLKEGPIWPFLNVWFRDRFFGIAVGGFGKIFITKDGGKNWKSLVGILNNPDGFHLYGIKELKNNIFIAGEGGVLFRGDSSAKHWINLNSPSDASFFGLNVLKSSNSVVVYGMKGLAFESYDFGEKWKQIFTLNNINHILVSSIILKNGEFCLLSHDGLFFCRKSVNSDFKKLPLKMLGCTSLCVAKGSYIFGACIRGVHKFKVNFGEK